MSDDDPAYDWRDYLDAGYLQIPMPARIVDTDGTVIEATFEVSAAAGVTEGITLTVQAQDPATKVHQAAWFSLDHTWACSSGLHTAATVDEPFATQLPAWSCDDPPEPRTIQIATDPDQVDGVYLHFGTFVLFSDDDAVATGLAIMAAFNYLVATDPAHSHRTWGW